jgi:hypothetical protein
LAFGRENLGLSAMNAAIVDTDVVSMLFKGDSRASGFPGYLAGRLLGISFMSLAEVGTAIRESFSDLIRAFHPRPNKPLSLNFDTLPLTSKALPMGNTS